MLQYLREKSKNIVVTLRFSLLSIFITLFVIMMMTLFSVFYFHLTELVDRAALFLLDKETARVVNDLNVHLSPIEGVSQFTAELIHDDVLDRNEMPAYLLHLLRKFILVDSVFWADMQGDFLSADEEENGNTSSIFIDRHLKSKQVQQTVTYWDKRDRFLKKLLLPTDYDPRNRMWFADAIANKTTSWTDVYVSAKKPLHLDVSIVTPVFKEGKPLGVFGMDVRLDFLSRYISAKKIRMKGDVFIVDKQGRLISSSQLEKLQNTSQLPKDRVVELENISKPYANAFQHFRKTQQPIFVFKQDNENYLIAFRKLPTIANQEWYLAITYPESVFTQPIRKVELVYLLIDLTIFVLGILLISMLVTHIVKPIKKLVNETKKIKNFELESTERVQSRIKEVLQLSDAMYAMKLGLRTFQKYIPSGLVRQLIRIGEDVRIGGVKRELAVFFSDINNFTQLSEKTNSNQLVEQVCQYFEALSHSITYEQGTIDKYIGDSIMAFWGAPMAIDDPCKHAAYAALACLEQTNLLNKAWGEEHKPLFKTRVGIHFGEAIVGNIGSSDRINYTALGDMVNITSRLINVNKVYGTIILVTESVYQQIKEDFILRFVDDVTFKGKKESMPIYELLATNKQRILFDIEAYRSYFDKAFFYYQQQNWQEAVAHFEVCLRIYPQDELALVFIQRCKWFEENPPSSQWDGIWHFSEK